MLFDFVHLAVILGHIGVVFRGYHSLKVNKVGKGRKEKYGGKGVVIFTHSWGKWG